MNIIEVENLRKSYKDTIALKDVSFHVEKNELFGLLGPDGAGKSTIFNILATLIHQDSGNAYLSGKDVKSKYKEIRKIIGYLPGKFSLYPDLTCFENLEFFATLYGGTIKQNMELIEPIWKQLEPFKNRAAGKLSGGMKQKLALCCALVHRPEVLLLDEPTTGVDPVARKDFWEILKNIKKEGITVLVSTPYMDEASLCDKVAMIYNGNILEINKPADVINNYGHILYCYVTDNMYKDLQIFQSNKNIICYPFGQQINFYLKKNYDDQKLQNFMEIHNLDLTHKHKTNPTIEDCFISLMIEKENHD